MRRPCPDCPSELSRFSLKQNIFYACPNQDGILVHQERVPKFVRDPKLASALMGFLAKESEAARPSTRKCPERSLGFEIFEAPIFASFQIDVYSLCKLFWFNRANGRR